MIDALETATGHGCWLQIEIGAINVGILVYQINQTPVRRADGGQLQFIGADQSAIRLTFVGHGPGQRAGAVLDAHRGGAQRGSMRFKEAVGERIRLGVEDQVDIALAHQAHTLGAVLPGLDETESLQPMA
ncbi:hypothetical protein D3C86_1771590 [compost metagenome]